MRELKLSTKAGRRVYDMGCRCCWDSLNNLYDNWSSAKQRAYDRCYEMFCNDEN